MKTGFDKKKYIERHHCKPSTKPEKECCGNVSNSAVIENSGNSKNHISFHSLAKSRAESSVKADAAQDQDQRIQF